MTDSALLYIMVVKVRNTICPQFSLYRGAALSAISTGTLAVHKGKGFLSGLVKKVNLPMSIGGFQFTQVQCYLVSTLQLVGRTFFA
jgi:hypothetical protein